MALLDLADEFGPISALVNLQGELQRFLNNPAFSLGLSGPSAYPPVNIFDDGEAMVIVAEVPGLDPASIQVVGRAQTLTISGDRKRPEIPDGAGYHRVERPFGRFSRSLQLPDHLDMAKASARYEAGMLIVRVPKQEAAKPRQITVAAA